MSLMNLVRSLGVLALAWTLVAIGIGASGTKLTGAKPAAWRASEPPPLDALPTGAPPADSYALVDRDSGRRTAIRLPDGNKWSIVSVSPWRGPGGELEAVGCWVEPEGKDFCGWGLFRLADGNLISRMPTETFPIGRPCWIPGEPRAILFAGADGRLHRCRLESEEESNEAEAAHGGSSRARALDHSEPVLWAVQQPGAGDVRIDDPAWPDCPRLGRWMVVALSDQVRNGHRLRFEPPRLWWLEMSAGGRTITAAWPAIPPSRETLLPDHVRERFPTVAVDHKGSMRLVYLEHSPRDRRTRLCTAPIELDPQTGRPSVRAGTARVLVGGGELAPSPLLVSSDGSRVFGLSRTGAFIAIALDGPAEEPASRATSAVRRDRP